jgi:EAL domain-containing protein (putative c-di-GMP-specific phosphodiesterase class I)
VLSVQLLNKLRPGGRTRRYEVLVRTRDNPTAIDAAAEILRSVGDADLDGFVVSQLFTWLGEHPQVRDQSPLTFSINLSPRALRDERFPSIIAAWLRKTGVPAESIGFELSESICIQHKADAERFVAACEKLGCFVVLDDFTLDTQASQFLRSKALRLLKLHSKLTNEAMKDKLSQAMVIAISQAAKVLGIHCAAKKIESQMVRRWITAIGFDFAQGTLFEGPRALEALQTVAKQE